MPLASDFDQQLRRLHHKGLSANRIAKELGCAVATVTAHAKKLGLTFDRTKTAAAVQAHTTDLRARRAAIIDRLYTRAEHVLGRLEADQYTYTVTIPGQGAEKVDDAEPPAQDERHLGSAISGYLTSAARLEQIDGAPGVTKTASIITRVAEAFGISDA